MTQYSVQPRDISKNLSGKYNKKRLNHAKKLQLMHLKLVQKE